MAVIFLIYDMKKLRPKVIFASFRLVGSRIQTQAFLHLSLHSCHPLLLPNPFVSLYKPLYLKAI